MRCVGVWVSHQLDICGEGMEPTIVPELQSHYNMVMLISESEHDPRFRILTSEARRSRRDIQRVREIMYRGNKVIAALEAKRAKYGIHK